MAKASATNRVCAKCGGRLTDGTYVFSRFTRTYYCADLAACDRRVQRGKKGERT